MQQVPTPTLAEFIEAEACKPWYRPYSSELRRLYDVRREAKRCAVARTAIGLLTLFYMSCFGLDLLLIPDVWKLSLMTRLVVTPIIGGIAFAYCRRGPGNIVEMRNALAIVIAATLWSIQLLATKNHVGALSYLALAPMIIIAANIFCNLSLKAAAATSLVVFLTMSGVLIMGVDAEHYFVIGDVFQLFWMAVLTLFVNWRSDRESVRLFLSRLTSELQRATIEKSNAELLRLSSIDALTGVANRRSVDVALDAFWRDWTVEGRSFALLLIDVDYFKRYNDGYGHLAGDQCLIAVARAIADVVAARDGVVGRFGGEEFIALLPVRSVETAVRIAAEIRSAVHRTEVAHAYRGDTIDIVTVSGGIAFSADEAHINALMRSADAALYRAKDGGRDRIGLANDNVATIAQKPVEAGVAQAA